MVQVPREETDTSVGLEVVVELHAPVYCAETYVSNEALVAALNDVRNDSDIAIGLEVVSCGGRELRLC